MQRRPARVGGVGVGAVIEQNGGKIEIGIHYRHVEGACAIGSNVIGVGSVRQQGLHRLFVAIADCEQEWREPSLGFGFDIGAELDQHLRGGGVALRSRPHESGLAFVGLLCIHLRAVREQRLEGVHLPGERRGHQHGLALFGGAASIRSGLQQALDHGRVPVGTGERKGGDVVARGGLHVRAGGD